MLASGVFVLADVRNNGGFSARTVGVYVGEDGGVIDFLEEEDVEVVLEVPENLAAHYRFLLQVVGQKTQFLKGGVWGGGEAVGTPSVGAYRTSVGAG